MAIDYYRSIMLKLLDCLSIQFLQRDIDCSGKALFFILLRGQHFYKLRSFFNQFARNFPVNLCRHRFLLDFKLLAFVGAPDAFSRLFAEVH